MPVPRDPEQRLIGKVGQPGEVAPPPLDAPVPPHLDDERDGQRRRRDPEHDLERPLGPERPAGRDRQPGEQQQPDVRQPGGTDRQIGGFSAETVAAVLVPAGRPIQRWARAAVCIANPARAAVRLTVVRSLRLVTAWISPCRAPTA